MSRKLTRQERMLFVRERRTRFIAKAKGDVDHFADDNGVQVATLGITPRAKHRAVAARATLV